MQIQLGRPAKWGFDDRWFKIKGSETMAVNLKVARLIYFCHNSLFPAALFTKIIKRARQSKLD